MRFVALVVLAFAAVSFAQEIEDGVYVGTEANFKQILATTDFVLAEFCKLQRYSDDRLMDAR